MIAILTIAGLALVAWRIVAWRRAVHEAIDRVSVGWLDEQIRGRRE